MAKGGRIIAMSPEAYAQKLDNEWFDRKYNEAVARDQRVDDAQIELMNAQAEYFKALTEKLRNGE